jgi:formiminoglutamase
MSFIPFSSSLFYKSTKTNDIRLGDVASQNVPLVPNRSPSIVVGGYPDDEGIEINGGRAGAHEAPDTIRKYLYKMTPTPWESFSETLFFDAGNLDISGSLPDRHSRAIDAVSDFLEKGHKWIAFGGGHDYGYVDGSAFLNSTRNEKLKPLIINFDAHLDVRDTSQGFSSGTPFYRLLSDFPTDSFELVQIGIQGQCNTPYHYQWCLNENVQIIDFQTLNVGYGFFETAVEALTEKTIQKRPTYISVDVDAFAAAHAPGCSQSWPTGLEPNSFMRLFHWLLQRLDVRVLGIYEVSPPLDVDDRTSKLAAQIAHQYIYP